MSNTAPDTGPLPCACSALRQAARAVSRHYEACLAPTGVTTTQYSILRYLQREGPAPLRRMADALELERTSLYRAMGPLKRDGLVASRTDPGDARVKLAELTPAGLEKIQEVFPVWSRAQESFLSAVGTGEWDKVAGELEGIRASITEDPAIRGQIRGGGRDL